MTATKGAQAGPELETIRVEGVDFLRLRHPDRMPPFLTTLASDTDCWAFIASSGGMTAGRVDPDGALFPYETVDRLYDSHDHSGPITLIRVGDRVWEPFAGEREHEVERCLDKSVLGHQLVFEEHHRGLGLKVRARWAACDSFGHVRTVTIENTGETPVGFEVLDGLRNLLPSGTLLALYQTRSCLVDAYKRVDVDEATGLAAVSLTARVVDRPEAAEALRANTIWQHGLETPTLSLSQETVDRFRRGDDQESEGQLTGQRANYFVRHAQELRPGARLRWHLVLDEGRDHVQVAQLRRQLIETSDLDAHIESELAASTVALHGLLASSDAQQSTANPVDDHHHLANVLFNVMRGGVFWDGHNVPTEDFRDFVAARNRPVFERSRKRLALLPDTLAIAELIDWTREHGNEDLERLALEYLPLHFGRRHGDPSRPWNRFAIRVRDRDGNRVLSYQGNWRDIFQNWESLALSFPGFLPGMIAKFVNASTVDGFNPYRITRDGIDWEIEEPDDPWSFIGYWGDHQIIYLLKLVEALEQFDPTALEEMLPRSVFTYAHVPYRLRAYDSIVRDPHATIDFDHEAAAAIERREEAVGQDGRLVVDAHENIVRVNLYEKLLVPALSKLSNLVADGGIWMNTQRPEWNDANNALVGNGVSMVTLCYLRRYLEFLRPIFARADRIEVSHEVCLWLDEVRGVLERFRSDLAEDRVDDTSRRALLDALGGAFGRYRVQAYEHGLSPHDTIQGGSIADLFRLALEHLDHAIAANRRSDGLLHAYNVLNLNGDTAAIERLDVMLEGQVAALSSGALKAEECLAVVDALFASPLYREDQKSFLLYPFRQLPTFFERNEVDETEALSIGLLSKMLDEGVTTILARDADGKLRFHGDVTRAEDLSPLLDEAARDKRWEAGVREHRESVLELFENTFQHRRFTGRSGTMYGYEGLGCIYWHMVAKLLLAVQEIALRRADERMIDETFIALCVAYYRIRGGLGFSKSPAEFGAFPTDPYSHTPGHAGAQQPGMTGQVKEEILTRFGELGLRVEEGRVGFRPHMLRRSEFLTEGASFESLDLTGEAISIDLPAGSLAFSFAQVPVIYELSGSDRWLRVHRSDGSVEETPGGLLDPDTSQALLRREGSIARIEVGIAEADLLDLI